MGRPLLEVCVEGLSGALAAQAGGADRVELCAGLVEGGTTPSAANVQLAQDRLSIPIVVLVRPRGGDFVVQGADRDVLLADIEWLRDRGVFGVAVGALTPDGRIDRSVLRDCIEAARPLRVTCHRAFDMTRDPSAALDTLIELGCDRVLTSGQRAAAPMAVPLLRELIQRAGDHIVVMPGAGIREEQIAEFASATGASELHFSARRRDSSTMEFRNPHCFMGATELPGEYDLRPTCTERVRRFLAAFDAP